MSRGLRTLSLGWIVLVVGGCAVAVALAWERNGPPPVDGILTDPWAIIGLLAMVGLVAMPVVLALSHKS